MSVASAHRGPSLRAGSAAVLLALAVADAAAAGAKLPAPAGDDLLIRVARGDTLIGLAATHLAPGTGWRALQRLNHVAEPRRLQPGSALRVPAAWLRAQDILAEVMHVRGQVRLQRAGGAAADTVEVGAMLRAGDRLRSDAESSATLRFADGSRLLLRPDSELRLVRMRQQVRGAAVDTGLQLDRGSADSRVPPAADAARRYEITTPSVHLGVRGTEFRAHVDADSTRVEVIEGSVQAAHAMTRGAQRVAAGEGALARPGQPALATGRLLAAPDLAAVAARFERVPLKLAWSAQPGAAAWQAQVYAAGSDDALMLDGRFAGPSAGWADLPDGRYQLRVRAIDERGLEGHDARRDFVLKARPVPPFTSQPRADAQVHGEKVGFAWTRAEDAASYRLQVAADEGFVPLVADLAALAQPTHELALAPGRYHWRLASVRADGDSGPFGDAQAFTLKPIPPAPPLQPPEIGGEALVLRWPALPAGHRYELQLASDREFQVVLQTRASTEPEATLSRPEAGVYFVRVRAIDADGYAGPYGSVQQVEVPRSRWWLLLPAGLFLLLVL